MSSHVFHDLSDILATSIEFDTITFDKASRSSVLIDHSLLRVFSVYWHTNAFELICVHIICN